MRFGNSALYGTEEVTTSEDKLPFSPSGCKDADQTGSRQKRKENRKRKVKTTNETADLSRQFIIMKKKYHTVSKRA